jgi:hypothetical protein
MPVILAEYGGLSSVKGGAPAVQTPPITVQSIAIGAGSVQSAAFDKATTIVRIHTDATAWLAFGSNPTAAVGNASTIRMAANQTEFFGVAPGHKLAVITGG